MFKSLRMKRLRRQTGRSLAADPTQPSGYEDWLTSLSTDLQLERCQEPSWLIHLGYWSKRPIHQLFLCAYRCLRFAATELESREGLKVLSDEEWRRIQAASRDGFADQFLDKSILLDIIARHEASWWIMPDALMAQHQLPLAEALGLNAAKFGVTDEVRFATKATCETASETALYVCAATTLVAFAAIYREYGQPENVGLACAQAVALLNRAFPEKKDQLKTSVISTLQL
jgi:hypothetical protein